MRLLPDVVVEILVSDNNKRKSLLLSATYLQDHFSYFAQSTSPPKIFKDFICKNALQILQISKGKGKDGCLFEHV
ncbi:33858_t:CDS:2 [Gigaspora margarita]|uniref:33858_t:CDS:1 n=1 Tax=Gigaspora margarita TaxID=4874 RepID=A0ABN7UJQ1_GIGMA|nr:33858_t:CDS:2 [Gigaspora margarita]